MEYKFFKNIFFIFGKVMENELKKQFPCKINLKIT
jgi:hypothetical protein